MGRGTKTCPSCGTTTGPRAYTCKNCNHAFTIHKGVTKLIKKRKGHKVEDWHELMPGDKIKVVAGSGPYWPASEIVQEDVPMGHYGKFIVASLDHNGIHAYEYPSGGHVFIYMGKTKKSSVTEMILKAHKIRKFGNMGD